MAKITRATMKWFGSTAGGSDIGQFGSLAAGSPTYEAVGAISAIQALSAWGTGWAAEITTSGTQANCFALEDMNAVCHVLSYGVSYLHEMGIPEWDAGTVYYQNSYAQLSGVVYYSLQDDNLNQNPSSSPAYWTQGVQGVVPAGAISMYGGTTAPTGYLLCNGASVLRSDYPTLFAAISTAFGAADGTHFNVPDMRGIFPRGVDGGAGNDPDRASRTAAKTGGATGDNVGSAQADAFKAHIHYAGSDSGVQSGPGSPELDSSANTHATTSTGGSETRPKNVGVNFIIKI
jgi:microcystin-dependent protein